MCIRDSTYSAYGACQPDGTQTRTVLTSTPAGQLDPGYISAQAAYLSKQLATLQAEQGDLSSAVSSFETSAKKLADRASALAGHS